MDKNLIVRLNKSFEDTAYEDNGVEYWLARDLQKLLEYDEWRNFTKVIEKAKVSCQTAKQNPAHHFVDVNKMVDLGSGGQRQVDDYMLTRYACYLIAQNGERDDGGRCAGQSQSGGAVVRTCYGAREATRRQTVGVPAHSARRDCGQQDTPGAGRNIHPWRRTQHELRIDKRDRPAFAGRPLPVPAADGSAVPRP